MRSIAITKPPPTGARRLLDLIRRSDPVLAAGIVLLVGMALWAAAPLANGISASSDTVINLEVPSATAVVPGLTAGATALELPLQTVPGAPKTATSSGWKLTTNWFNGYVVTLRATTDPALRGRNATDGGGSRFYFNDFGVGGCPCPWLAEGERGVFGYSVNLSTSSGAAADNSKWVDGSALKWRGLTTGGYELFQTPPGAGEYSMDLLFRTEIPRGGVQPAGTYRANLVLAIAPLL